jgi:hypothetical protein
MNQEGEIGKLNLDAGKMYNIWCHHGGQTDRGSHLVMQNGIMQEWKPIKSGEYLPPGAIHGGNTRTDGDVYVGRNKDGACGKINLNRDGTIKNLWIHGNMLPWKEGEILVCVGGGAPVAVAMPVAQATPIAQAIPVRPSAPPAMAAQAMQGLSQAMQGLSMGGAGPRWNPNAICDKSTAQERVNWLTQNQGMNVQAARQKVMSEFPEQFGGAGGGFSTGGWNPNAMCDGSRAEERATWLRDNKGVNIDMARQQVMREFPSQFGGGFGGGYGGGKVFNPNANCGGIRAEERVLWLQQNEHLSIEMARQRVMQEFPTSF